MGMGMLILGPGPSPIHIYGGKMLVAVLPESQCLMISYGTGAERQAIKQISNAQADVAMSAIVLKKIVASNWNVTMEYVWTKLCEFERALGRVKITGNRGQQEPLDQLEEILTAVNLFRRRLFWYLDEVESSLRSVGIDIDKESDDEGKELLSVQKRLQGFKEKVESFTSVVTGILSVRQADVSQKERKLVSRLKVLALVFIPLSFTASIQHGWRLSPWQLAFLGLFCSGGAYDFYHSCSCLVVAWTNVDMSIVIINNTIRSTLRQYVCAADIVRLDNLSSDSTGPR